jgi:hypothetical protein
MIIPHYCLLLVYLLPTDMQDPREDLWGTGKIFLCGPLVNDQFYHQGRQKRENQSLLSLEKWSWELRKTLILIVIIYSSYKELVVISDNRRGPKLCWAPEKCMHVALYYIRTSRAWTSYILFWWCSIEWYHQNPFSSKDVRPRIKLRVPL